MQASQQPLQRQSKAQPAACLPTRPSLPARLRKPCATPCQHEQRHQVLQHERCASAASTSGAAATGSRGDGRARCTDRRRRVLCGASAAALSDPADVIPGAYDDDDDEEGRVVPSTQKVAVVGGGPSGLLTALYLARRGYNVEVFEREPAPGVEAVWRQSNYPMVLSSRALVAFRELKLQTPYNGPDAPLQQGTWDLTTGHMELSQPDDQNLQSAVVDRLGLTAALAAEARRLYPSQIRISYATELWSLDVRNRQATVITTSPVAGASQQCAADRSHRGAPLSVSCSRAPSAEQAKARTAAAAAVAGIPAWDTAALQAAGLLLPPDAGGGAPASAAPKVRLVGYDLLVGADGSDSRVRRLMQSARPKVRNFDVQLPSVDGETYRGFSGLPQSPASSSSSSSASALAARGELVPGFSAHRPRQYLYRASAPDGQPRLDLWVSEPGTVSGILIMPQGFNWAGGAAAVRQAVDAAPWASKLPAGWTDAIVAQVCDPKGPAPRPMGRTVQVSQFHGPKLVLVGDAAHGMTNESRQGLNCAVETVRLLNVVLKISGDNLTRLGNVLTELRGEDAHCVQMMEGMQRSLRPGLVHGDFMFAAASWLGRIVWRAASLMAALLAALAPSMGFRAVWVPAALADCRRGYGEVLKVLTRFAAFPILVALGVTGFLLRGAIVAFVKGL